MKLKEINNMQRWKSIKAYKESKCTCWESHWEGKEESKLWILAAKMKGLTAGKYFHTLGVLTFKNVEIFFIPTGQQKNAGQLREHMERDRETSNKME